MKSIKRIIALILVFIFVIGAVFISYTGIKNGAVVYATVDDDSIYVPLRSESDAVKAFQSYCKSRDLTIEGSLTDAVTTFTTGAFNSACNEIGIDITELQAEIKAEYDQSGKPVKFLFNDSGVMAMNRIFAQFLQDNELEVGDSANQNDNTVYSGYLIVDDDNNTALAYVLNSGFTSANRVTSKLNNIVQEGTPIKYDVPDLKRLANNGNTNFTINYNNNHYNFPLGRDGDLYYFTASYFPNVLGNAIYCPASRGDYTNIKGFGIPCFMITPDNTLYLCKYSNFSATDGSTTYYWYKEESVSRVSNNSQPATVYITTNNTVINNNNYEGDTIINNEGDVINNNPDNPDFPDYPEQPTGNVNDWGAEMPNLDIPWYLQGKEDKFPWNIPFNIMLTLSLLKAEPQAPHFEGTMDFKFTTYDYEIDLSQFDDVAEVLRKMEVIAFLIGLMVLTRNLIGW